MNHASLHSSSPMNGPHILSSLFLRHYGFPPAAAVRLLGAGSDREYWRLSAEGISAIGVMADNKEEAEAFVGLSGVFRENGIAVPEVYAHTPCFSAYLVQDLGGVDLFSLLGRENTETLLERCMDSLAAMQTVPEVEWKDKVAFPPFSARLVGWDLNYFKYEYLKPSGVPFSEDALEDDFRAMSESLLSIPPSGRGFMMRDCQSRNVMVCEGAPYWIDFQGGRRGPALYDAVSFIYQAKAAFPEEVRRRLLERYARAFSLRRGISQEELLSDLPLLRLFRCLQVLGAYGFRGLVQRRAHFIESIRPALRNLSSLLREGAVDGYPELKRVAESLVADPRFAPRASQGLEVSVFSFSYKKGYPDDFSGNGGGFMFDCRALHNPGRYEEYKALTGLDLPVREFLESRGEVYPFLEACSALVVPAVERYVARGFTSLQIGFGCTGGQHRSVYCAHSMADMLRNRFPEVRVAEIHREQGKRFDYSPGKEVSE